MAKTGTARQKGESRKFCVLWSFAPLEIIVHKKGKKQIFYIF